MDTKFEEDSWSKTYEKFDPNDQILTNDDEINFSKQCYFCKSNLEFRAGNVKTEGSYWCTNKNCHYNFNINCYDLAITDVEWLIEDKIINLSINLDHISVYTKFVSSDMISGENIDFRINLICNFDKTNDLINRYVKLTLFK